MSYRIGITGGIGSGKSFVSHILEQQCAVPVYDCDSQAKHLMTHDTVLMDGIRKLVGDCAYNERGELNRSVVATYLFACPQHAADINALVHPAVCRDFLRWTQKQTAPVVAVESAILLESGLQELVDGILLVDASEQTRLERAMQRDGATLEQIRARMAQQNVTQMREAATWVIQNENNTTEEQIYKQKKELGIC